MDNVTKNNTNNNEDAAKHIKRLHALVESNEVQSYLKRIAEIKKRVEKLYTHERARLSELASDRARQDQEEQERILAEREAARAAEQPQHVEELVQEQSDAVEQTEEVVQPKASEPTKEKPVEKETPSAESSSS